MTEWENVNLRVAPERKDEWKQYVDDSPEAGNLSQLIRLAVTRHMQSEEPQQERRQPETSGEVLEALNGINNTLDDMEERLGALERESQQTGPMYSLEKVAFDRLPVRPDEWGTTPVEKWGKTAEDIAREINAEIDDVKEALERRSRKISLIQSAEGDVDDRRYYWRKE